MKKILVILICFAFLDAISQSTQQTGTYEKVFFENGIIKTKILTNPLINSGKNRMINEKNPSQCDKPSSSMVRWFTTQTYAIGNDVSISGNGQVGYCGWGLNEEHVSAFGNVNSTPFWEYFTSTSTDRNYVAASDTGIVATGSYHNIYIMEKNSGTPFFNFDLTTLPDTGTAGAIDITSNGGFVVASVWRYDSSTVFGFNKTSTTPVWKLRVPTRLYGVRISRNDSLAIISTYYNFWVVNTFSGVVRYKDTITNGTQMTMGISGNGNLIATVNYRGYMKVYQWSGTAYTLLWQFQEPPGTYYNWITAVDISNDGNYIATGSLIFLSSSSYDGKVRFFKVSNGNTPLWTLSDIGDEVVWVEFSKNGKILAASSYGDLANTKNDLLVFKPSVNSSTPIFSTNMIGSPYYCSISDDGTNLIAGGKLVHARVMGHGGTFYNVSVDTSETPNIVGNVNGNTPKEYSLGQNYPNPFNPSTNIKYQTAKNGFVTLKILDILGKEVAVLVSEYKKAGYYEVQLTNQNLPSGFYFYRLQANEFSNTKKLILIK